MRIIVIGGDAAGMSAASRARRNSPESEVVVYEKGSYVSYSACGMPFFIGGVVPDFDSLIHYPLSKFTGERRIDVHINSEVLEINPERKEVVVNSSEGKFSDHYDALVIATGARARIPDEFSGLKGVYTLRTLNELRTMEDAVKSAKDAVIVGAGYIGLEMAEAFTKRGIKVSIIQRSERILRGLDREMMETVKETLKRNGIDILLNSRIDKINSENGKITGVTTGSRYIPADLLFVSVGVIPNSEIAVNAGILTGVSNAIKVNERMETNIRGIYAAGDVATTRNMVNGKDTYFPLATGSNKEGRTAGENAVGGSAEYAGICATEVVKVFDLEIGRVGLSDEEALESGFKPVFSTITSTSRASYYPGATTITIKLMADLGTHRLIGANLMGKEGVAKRLDVLASAMYSKLMVEDLTKIDYSYSPPFSPTWEPIGVAADVLLGKLKRMGTS